MPSALGRPRSGHCACRVCKEESRGAAQCTPAPHALSPSQSEVPPASLSLELCLTARSSILCRLRPGKVAAASIGERSAYLVRVGGRVGVKVGVGLGLGLGLGLGSHGGGLRFHGWPTKRVRVRVRVRARWGREVGVPKGRPLGRAAIRRRSVRWLLARDLPRRHRCRCRSNQLKLCAARPRPLGRGEGRERSARPLRRVAVRGGAHPPPLAGRLVGIL